MKYVVKIFTLLAVFIASIWFFGSNMDEVMFQIEKNVEMSKTSLPTIATRSDGALANCLYGYTSPIDKFSVRENFVSVEADKVVELLIDENGTDVRKVYYDVSDVVTKEEIAQGTINALEHEGDLKRARIRLTAEMESGKEYVVEIMLVDSESRRIYYYFRMKYYESTCFAEKVNLMQSFSEHARTKQYTEVIPYLESTYRGEGSSYAKVDIEDSYYMVCWGGLQPTLLTEPVLQLSEVYSNIAVGTLTYMVEIATDIGVEQYYVTEKFRVIVTDIATHLLNYERTLETVFDASNASTSQNQFKLGITNETDMELPTNSDHSMLAFVRNKELWHYNMAENKLSKVYSLRNDKEAEEGRSCEEYDIRILNLYENGDISFMVYGYMARGEYEGKTGILLYRYYRGEDRIEEQLYLPISATYQKINRELGSFSYMNEYDVFYFMAYQMLYSYNLITEELHVISENAAEESVVFFRTGGYVAWQEETKNAVELLFLETGERKQITASENEFVRVLGKIDDNMILGYGMETDLLLSGDGAVVYPAYQVKITDKDGQIKKVYQKEGYYTIDADAEDNSVCLKRLKKTANGYAEAPDDYIINSVAAEKRAVTLETRVTDLMFVEYYIDLPSTYKMKEVPEAEPVPHTIITKDTTVRIEALDEIRERYVVYSFGEMILLTEDATEAILLADESNVVGTVVNEAGCVVWERGVKFSADYVEPVSGVSCKESGLNSRQAVIRMMASSIGFELPAEEFAGTDSVKAFLEQWTGHRVISLSGITLDEALYFVYKGMPVYAMKDADSAVLITGYNASSVTVYDPEKGKSEVLPLNDAKEAFLKVGNIFVSFLP